MRPHPRRILLALAAAALALPVLFPRPAPATVEEQRARLPPPATCQDPVEGVWMAHLFEAYRDHWYVFTLRIRRAAGAPGLLVGDITANWWLGDRTQTEPPPTCMPGGLHRLVFMPARGSVVDGVVDFGGTEWRPLNSLCGSPNGTWGYNPDHFTGRIDPAIQEFQSVNNDGGEAVNEPTVFRRVRCFDAPAPTPALVVAPPLQPPTRARGCSR